MTDGLSRGTSAPNPFHIRPAGVPFVVDLTDKRCKRAAQSARTRLKSVALRQQPLPPGVA